MTAFYTQKSHEREMFPELPYEMKRSFHLSCVKSILAFNVKLKATLCSISISTCRKVAGFSKKMFAITIEDKISNANEIFLISILSSQQEMYL